jgi:hypothetical protein
MHLKICSRQMRRNFWNHYRLQILSVSINMSHIMLRQQRLLTAGETKKLDDGEILAEYEILIRVK